MRTGSPRHIDVKGDHEKEYAWFKGAGSSRVLTQNPGLAARTIIKALEYGEREAVLSLSGKLAMVVKGLAPGWTSLAMALANRLLPDNGPYGDITLKGYESESGLSQGSVTSLADQEAQKNNEM